MVEGRLSIKEVTDPPTGQAPGNTRTDMHILPEAAQPGDYVVLTIAGVAYVQVDPAATITPGMRLAVSDGLARPLQSVEINGVSLAENAAVIGTALEAGGPGKSMITAFVSVR